jgi:hypothetical protein
MQLTVTGKRMDVDNLGRSHATVMIASIHGSRCGTRGASVP